MSSEEKIPKKIYMVPYVLWWNEKAYEIDADLFAKYSKKFKTEREKEENRNQMDIEVKLDNGDDVPEDIFLAFVNACQLKPFDVNKKNVYQLLDLAHKWQVSSLLQYIEKYIRDKNIDPPVIPNYLEILIDKIEGGTDSHKDWESVANHLNQSLEDPLFEQIPTEIIYQILAYADKKNFDQKALIKFTMKMIRKMPKSAVPLILRLDFDKLTSEQRDEIFHTAAVHTLNINFFTSSSISALYNKNHAHIEKRKRKQTLDFKCLEFALDKLCEKQLKDLNKQYRDEVDEIKDEIYRQQAIIDKLKDRINEHKRRMLLAEKKQLSRRKPVDEQTIQNLSESVRAQLLEMEDAIDKAHQEHEKSLNLLDDKACQVAHDFYSKALERSDSEQSKVSVALIRLKEACKDSKLNVKAVDAELSAVRATIFAKIVRDRLRYSQYLRKTNNRFNLFDKDPHLYNLTAQAVKAAEDEIRLMDKRVEELCPMRAQAPQQDHLPVPKRVKRMIDASQLDIEQ